jgi:hypothetical protein
MRKRQAHDVSYPRAGGNAGIPIHPRVSFTGNDEVIGQGPTLAPESLETLDHGLEEAAMEEDSGSEEEEERPWKQTRQVSRKTGTQRARWVPIKLRLEAQPEEMVDRSSTSISIVLRCMSY